MPRRTAPTRSSSAPRSSGATCAASTSPYGPAGFYIYAYGGVPYDRYSDGYDLQGDNRRTSAYAQDQWSIGRLTLNLGLRTGSHPRLQPCLEGDRLHAKAAWGPRVGAAFESPATERRC